VNAFQSSPGQRQPAPVHNLVLLAWMWAAFTLFHQGHDNHWARTPLEGIETASAVAVLVGPTHVTRFVLLTVFQAAHLWWLMPEPTNHATFALIVDLTIVVAAIGHVLSRGVRQGFDGAALYRSFAPALRVSVILLYVFATIAKINTAFLDPTQSCGAHHYTVLRGHLASVGIWLPGGQPFNVAAIAATLLIEGGIPALLAFTRTRPLGVLVALVFHYLLGLNPFYDFSSMIYALLVLFTPDHFSAVVEQTWLRSALRGVIDRARERLVSIAGIVAVLAAGTVVALLVLQGNHWTRVFGPPYAVWPLYGAVILVLAAPALIHRLRTRAITTLARPVGGAGVMMAAPLLVVLNGMCPYLGLKTDSSFAMFSNLRTERGFANHLVIPPGPQPFGFQSDLVRVVRSSDPMLARSARAHELVPFFTLRNQVSGLAAAGRRNIAVVFERGGVVHDVRRAELDPELATRYPFLLRKILKFRPIDMMAPGRCTH
jgi:hypothetical protein